MLLKNQIYTAEITDYTVEGQGIAHIDGCVVFVPCGIAGEVCEIQIEKAAKTWASGKIKRILEISPHRCDRDCPHGKKCGGCAFQHMDYAEETRLKAARVTDALNRLGGEALDTVKIHAAPEISGYRNKAQYPVTMSKNKVLAGFYQEGTHDVIYTERCGLLPPEMDQIRDIVVDHMNQYRISAYNENTRKGLVRHIYVRKGWVSKALLVCLVINGDQFPKAEALISKLQKVPGFETLVLSHHKKPGNAVLGQEFTTLYGNGWIEDTLCGLTFRLSPRSFYQVNHDQAEKLYGLAISAAEIQPTDTVLDLYCGVGTITLAMARHAGKVIGVELEPQAVADAHENALRNGLTNTEFFCGDAGAAALDLQRRGLTPDVVVVDPPRKGLSPDVIEAVDQMAPRKVVYVSCDPATLARDVARFKEKDFSLKSAQAVDLFPRCAHVETVVVLSKAAQEAE